MCWRCPVCFQPLHAVPNGWQCAQKHHFDRAREGYLHLLPVQHKHSRQPGDNALMMQARRRFLDAGYYQPLQQNVAAQLSALFMHKPLRLLDIGCGEGYYTSAVAARFAHRSDCKFFGLDIAKPAIRSAARRYRHVQFCVASAYRLPFCHASFDAALRIFAPCKLQELERVIRPEGWLLTVTPGPRHLVQLKAHLYSDVRLHDVKDVPPDGFSLFRRSALSFDMQLTGEDAAALLQMTPFAWRASEAFRQYLISQKTFCCEADFVVHLWRRDALK